MINQSFLLLQGPGSPFFAMLGCALLRAGHAVLRINFCGGDLLFGMGLPAENYLGTHDEAPAFFDSVMSRHAVTDLVLFGDCRPIHRMAMQVAEARGVRIWVFEEGYLRPDWITLERNGVNGYSTLPTNPDEIRMQAARFSDREDHKMPGGFKRRVIFDILYYTANAIFYPIFRNFRTHRLYPMPFEYAGWVRRLTLRILRRDEKRAVRCTQGLIASLTPFYLFPLQLDTDFQIRIHSPYGRLNPVIEHVLDSFATHAPDNSALVIKNHPLDNGMVELRGFVERHAAKRGVEKRVFFIDGGHLPTLLSVCRAVVVVNSTVGFSALIHGKPLKALGQAFYNMPGLTYQGGLDDFWTCQERPDRELVTAVRKVVMHTTQINGNLFTKLGLANAVPLAVKRLTEQVEG